MSDKVHLQKINDTYNKIICEPGILFELKDHFTFFAPNYKFHPKYKARQWDGKISLINSLTGYIYAGLAQEIKKFCDTRGYQFTFDESLVYSEISVAEFMEFIKTLNLPFEPRDYQINACIKAIRSNRRTIISPTSSGKSLIIYLLFRWYNIKTLLIVPSTNLVRQMISDFKSYGYQGEYHSSIGGLSKSIIDEQLTVTTWQSITASKPKLSQSWFDQFKDGLTMVDECHGCSAMSLISIMTKLTKTPHRFGLTGTLAEDRGNNLTIQGLFGPIFNVTTTKQLQDRGEVSKLKIKVIVLHYPEEVCRLIKDCTWQQEIDYIVQNKARNNFIKNLMLSLEGNSLCLVQYIEKHGKILKDLLTNQNKTLYYIDGGVDSSVREEIRHILEVEDNANLVASFGTTSTGWSLKKLHNLILGSSTKSVIRLLQSIGRTLRLHESKDQAILYDIVDDLSYKNHKNYVLKHFTERAKIYDTEGFTYKFYHVFLKKMD